jgi:hypothetical protein
MPAQRNISLVPAAFLVWPWKQFSNDGPISSRMFPQFDDWHPISLNLHAFLPDMAASRGIEPQGRMRRTAEDALNCAALC